MDTWLVYPAVPVVTDRSVTLSTVHIVTLFLYLIVGVLAQFVDSTLGMAFGLTSSTLLVFSGASPLVASASVHTAEIGTTFLSGLAHWRAGNVDRSVLLRIALPGSMAAGLGATVLSTVSLTAARPYVSVLLLILGMLLVLRFGFGMNLFRSTRGSSKLLPPLGAVAGFVDATAGGGWGPIATPTLLSVTDHEPRKVVGTVSAAEFLVSLSAVLGFIFGSTFSGVNPLVVLGLLLGGAIVAPFSAKLATRLNPQKFGLLIGLLVISTNTDVLLKTLGAQPMLRLAAFLPAVLGAGTLLVAYLRRSMAWST